MGVEWKNGRNILFIISQFYPVEGGAERQAFLLAEHLINEGAHVHVVTGRWERAWPKKEQRDGVWIFRNCTLGNQWRWSWMRNLSGVVYMVTLFWFLLFHGRKYDIFHVHQAFYPAFVTVIAGRIFRKPVIVKIGVGGGINDLKLMDQGRFFLSRWMARWIRKANRFVAISTQIKEELVALGIAENKIVSIPNGVRLSGGTKKDYRLHDPVKIVFVGRLNPEKRCDLLIESADNVREDFPVVLHIFGEGPLRQQLEGLVKERKLEDTVRFQGYDDTIREKLPGYDLFVLPSEAEGMSNALLEAMSCGLPCVVSDISPNLELISSDRVKIKLATGEYFTAESGVIFHVNDSVGLANAIRFLISDETARRGVGQNARKYIKKEYSIDEVAQEYVELYSKLLDS